jgi:hypothetical protein
MYPHMQRRICHLLRTGIGEDYAPWNRRFSAIAAPCSKAPDAAKRMTQRKPRREYIGRS